MFFGLGAAAELFQGDAQVAVRLGVRRVDLQSFGERRGRGLEVSGVVPQQPQVVVRLGDIGVQGGRPLEVQHGLPLIAQHAMHRDEADVRLRMVGVDLQHGVVESERLLQLAGVLLSEALFRRGVRASCAWSSSSASSSGSA